MSNTEQKIEEPILPTIDKIHTPCKKCAFAIYEDRTQKGCHLNYIDKYKNHNVDILEAYDDELEFFIINKKKCLGYRENSFFPEDSTIEEKINTFHQTNFIQYLMVINLKDMSSDELTQIGDKIKNLSIQPQKLIFVRYQDKDQRHSYFNIEKIIKDSNYKNLWEVKTMVVDSPYYNVLHEVINVNKKYRFVLSVNRFGDFENLVHTANKTVYEDLASFVSYINKDKSSLLFSAPNYRYCLMIDKRDVFTDEQLQTIVE
jgi:hypothetical protein